MERECFSKCKPRKTTGTSWYVLISNGLGETSGGWHIGCFICSARQPGSQATIRFQDCLSFGKYNAVFAQTHTLTQLMLIYGSACQPTALISALHDVQIIWLPGNEPHRHRHQHYAHEAHTFTLLHRLLNTLQGTGAKCIFNAAQMWQVLGQA